jgi:hypothetical protein
VTPSLTPTPSQSFTITPTFSASPTITMTSTLFIRGELLKPLGFYPNPFWDQGHAGYLLGEDAVVTVRVYNVAGEPVLMRSEAKTRGPNISSWKGDNESGGRCASGVYLMQVEAKHENETASFWVRAVIAR